MSEHPFDLATLERLALLARLKIAADKKPSLVKQLSSVVEHMAQIESTDLHDVPPTDHASAAQSPLREDVVVPSLDLQEVLRNAPERLGDGFGVPQILAPGSTAP